MKKTVALIIVLVLFSTIISASFLNLGVKEFPLTDDKFEIYTTEEGVDFVRTPDTFFEELPDWPYEVKYVEIDGLRQAYVDEGHRVIAMDHLGMGRSDKPVLPEYHSYDNHVYRLEQFIVQLGLTDITAFVQDWGSLIGLNVIGNHPEWFARVVVGDGALPPVPKDEVLFPVPEDMEAAMKNFSARIRLIPPQQPEFFDKNGDPKAIFTASGNETYFGNWILYSRYAEDFRASTIVEAMTYFPLSEAEQDACDEPFPARTTHRDGGV